MRSPILEVYPNSSWRDRVSTTWTYLEQHYYISSDYKCATHIHISLMPNYELKDLQRIASSAIYFEPALEALVPEERRRSGYAKSIWLHSPSFGRGMISRSAAIALIESTGSKQCLLQLLQGSDTYYSWNFRNMADREAKKTIEFRKAPASLTAEEVLSWAEFAMNFAQASIEYGSSGRLEDFTPNVGGLRSFLAKVCVPGVNEPRRLERIWAGKKPEAALEPYYIPQNNIHYRGD
jgi:Putative amidoligase enzyme